MKNKTPFNVTLKTVEDVDNACQFLSTTWGRSFSHPPKADGKKKNALRDMVCNLAGYTNGFKSFMAELEAKIFPAPNQSFDLPNDIYLKCDSEMNYLYLGKGTGGLDRTNDTAESLGFEHDDFIEALYADDDYLCDVPDDFDDQVNEVSLRDKQIWRYIAKYYHVRIFKAILPSIDKYGLTEESDINMAVDYLENIGLKFSDDPYDQHVVEDRGDDGGQTLVIWLTKKVVKASQYEGEVWDVTDPENPRFVTSQYTITAESKHDAREILIKETRQGDAATHDRELDVQNLRKIKR